MTFEDFIKEWHGVTPYITAHTSGSTGEPKEIELQKEFVKRSAMRTNRFFSIGKDSRLHSCVAADFIGGKMMAVRSLIAECCFTWEKPSNRPLQQMSNNDEITLLAVVPSQMIHILDHFEEMPVIQNVLIGGAAIPTELRKRIAQSGLNAFESYGMTETASHIALRKVEEEEGWFDALPGIEVTNDERGCLVIEFETGERFVTNDMSIFDGKRFKIAGRIDNVIITGGKKVSPERIERKVSHLFNGDILVSSEPHPKWGEQVILLAEEKEPVAGEGMLMKEMRKILEGWEMPKRISWNIRLPRTPNGKIKRDIGTKVEKKVDK